MSTKDRFDAPLNLHREDAKSEDYLQGYADGIAASRGQATAPRADGDMGREDAARAEWAANANKPFFKRPEHQGATATPATATRADDTGEDKEDRARAEHLKRANLPFWKR